MSLAWVRLWNFTRRTLASPVRAWSHEEEGAREVSLVLRVGLVVPAEVRNWESVLPIALDVFSTVFVAAERLVPEFASTLPRRRASSTPFECHVVTTLAGEAEQALASAAQTVGFRLHVVLPGTRHSVELEASGGHSTGDRPATRLAGSGRRGLNELLDRADRIFELDAPIESGAGNGHRRASYRRADEVLVENCDLLMLVEDDGGVAGQDRTGLFRHRARQAALPVISIPTGEPAQSRLEWIASNRPTTVSLFSASRNLDCSPVIDAVLRPILLLGKEGFCLSDSGLLERAHRRSLKIQHNEVYWEQQWCGGADDGILLTAAEKLKSHVRQFYQPYAVWADNRASAYGDLYRGGFIATLVLGTLAVTVGLIGTLWNTASVPSKFAEFILLLCAALLVHRAHHKYWRIRYVNYRQIDRELTQAAFLSSLGRSIDVPIPAHAVRFHDEARWANWYVRAIVRQAGLPPVRITRDYLLAISSILLNGQIGAQLRYFDTEITPNERTEAQLQQVVSALVLSAFALVAIYLGVLALESWLPRSPLVQAIETYHEAIRSVVTFGTVALPAWAACLSAIRTHGEYGQVAARYIGTSNALRRQERILTSMHDDQGSGYRNFPSGSFADIATQNAQVLVQELQQWRTLAKELEAGG